MAIKVYGIYGRTAAVLQLPVNGGKAHYDVEFANGNVSDTPSNRPALHSSADPCEQIIIESSELFKKGLIQLVRVHEDENDIKQAEEEAAQKAAKAAAAAKTDKKAGAAKTSSEYPDVTSIEEVRTVLKALGAKAGVLADEEAMKTYIAKNNISFPNFEF